jgi:hypothetical protein
MPRECLAWLQASRRWRSQQKRAWALLIDKLGYVTKCLRRARALRRKPPQAPPLYQAQHLAPCLKSLNTQQAPTFSRSPAETPSAGSFLGMVVLRI